MTQKISTKRALTFIVVTIIIDMMGFAMIMPVLPDLIREVAAGTYAEAAVIGGWLAFSWALMQFFFAPLLGNLSDAVGRRPVLILGLLVLALDYVIMALAPTLFLLFIGRLLAGAAGASYTVASAYVADVSPPEKRAANFGLIGMAFGIGFIIGPVIGGFLGEFGTRWPFWAAAGLALLNAAFGYFVLPESLAQHKRRKFSIKRANPLGTFREFIALPVVALLIVAAMVFELAQQVYPVIWSFWGSERFDWSPKDIGLTLTIFGLGIAIAEGWLLRILLNRFPEHQVLVMSSILSIVCLLGFGLASYEWLVWLLLIPSAFTGYANSIMQGMATNQVDDTQQGELAGAFTSSVSIVAFIAPPMMSGAFYFFTKSGVDSDWYFPGAPFVLAALIVIVMFLPYSMSRSAVSRH